MLLNHQIPPKNSYDGAGICQNSYYKKLTVSSMNFEAYVKINFMVLGITTNLVDQFTVVTIISSNNMGYHRFYIYGKDKIL